jgi:hypothetical protein
LLFAAEDVKRDRTQDDETAHGGQFTKVSVNDVPRELLEADARLLGLF